MKIFKEQTMRNVVKIKLAAIIATGFLASFAASANATQILGYSQSSGSNTLTATQNGTATATALSLVNVGIAVGNYLGGGAPFAAIINMTANSTDAATNVAGILHQSFTGTFCITSAAGCGGTNYLSGTFVDDFTGNNGGSSATLSATTPPNTSVTFTSSVLTPAQLDVNRAMSFSLSNLIPPLAICGTTICSFTASQSGTFSANNATVRTPEPSSMLLLGIGLVGLVGWARKRRAL